MALGRISEYLAVAKLNDTDLMDVSQVDGGALSGYVTRKTTISQFISSYPSIYYGDGDLLGNRTVDHNGNFLHFNNGDFEVDSVNSGIVYDNLTKLTGFGAAIPSAKVHIKGGIDDNLLLMENSLGNDRFIQNKDGQIGTGAGANASIQAAFGQYNVANGYGFGFGYYPTNCTTAGVTVQMLGTTDVGLSIATQGGKTGTVTGASAAVISTGNIIANGFYGNSRDASTISRGVFGQFGGGASIVPSNYGAGIEGRADSNVDAEQYGGHGIAQFNNIALLYTEDLIGLKGHAGGNFALGTTTSNIIGGKFSTLSTPTTGDKIAILVPETDNDGVVVFGSDIVNGDAILQTTGKVSMFSLPTSITGLSAGDLWNNAGVINIV